MTTGEFFPVNPLNALPLLPLLFYGFPRGHVADDRTGPRSAAPTMSRIVGTIGFGRIEEGDSSVVGRADPRPAQLRSMNGRPSEELPKGQEREARN